MSKAKIDLDDLFEIIWEKSGDAEYLRLQEVDRNNKRLADIRGNITELKERLERLTKQDTLQSETIERLMKENESLKLSKEDNHSQETQPQYSTLRNAENRQD